MYTRASQGDYRGLNTALASGLVGAGERIPYGVGAAWDAFVVDSVAGKVADAMQNEYKSPYQR